MVKYERAYVDDKVVGVAPALAIVCRCGLAARRAVCKRGASGEIAHAAKLLRYRIVPNQRRAPITVIARVMKTWGGGNIIAC